MHQLPLLSGKLAQVLGWALVGVGVLLFGWSLLTMRRHRTTVNPFGASSALCTDGPFRFSRNPIYLGDWFVLFGVASILSSAWPLLFAPVIWLVIRYGVIRHEEAHLKCCFGEAYREYQERVRRWL
ncbi:MAG: hypothetical protein NVS2B4_01420 [Ramlibacter sp.]